VPLKPFSNKTVTGCRSSNIIMLMICDVCVSSFLLFVIECDNFSLPHSSTHNLFPLHSLLSLRFFPILLFSPSSPSHHAPDSPTYSFLNSSSARPSLTSPCSTLLFSAPWSSSMQAFPCPWLLRTETVGEVNSLLGYCVV